MSNKPSAFAGKSTMGSVKQSSEHETIASNIMKILERTGDVFRPLSWDEYSEERKKDGNFTSRERTYFDGVIDFFKSADTARLFCDGWKI